MNNKKMTGKPELLKILNQNAVLKLIIKEKEVSRTQISKETGLALPSVMRIIDRLIEDGLVIDIGKGDSSGGRKPNLITINNTEMFIFGVEIGEKTVVILSEFSGKIIEKHIIKHEKTDNPQIILDKILFMIENIICDRKIDENKIFGIGVGTPGTDFKHIKDVKLSIIKGWETIDVKEWFSKRTNILIEVENVARTRTLSELWFGLGKALKNFVYIYIDKGVGCGIVSNGVIIKGNNGVSGEFGHTVIEFDGKDCYCGNHGCLEMYVSAGAIVNSVHELPEEKYQNYEFDDVISNQNDDLINDLLIGKGKILGFGIGNLINILNPETVIIGGIVPTNLNNYTVTAMKYAGNTVFSKSASDTKILLSELDKDFECMGSVALILDKVFKSIEL